MTGKTFRKLMRADREAIEGIGQDIRAAASVGDGRFVRHGFKLLLSVMDGAQETMETYFKPLPGSGRLGASIPEDVGKSWIYGSPQEILENMYVAKSMYETFIEDWNWAADFSDEDEARQFDRRRVNYMRRLAIIVIVGKDLISKNDQQFWTDKMEHDFKDWLSFEFEP
jgi:hypothetical protein